MPIELVPLVPRPPTTVTTARIFKQAVGWVEQQPLATIRLVDKIANIEPLDGG